jgi:hypothetical protein
MKGFMEQKDRKSINTLSIVLIVISALMILGNSMGAAVFILTGMLDGVSQSEIPMNSGMFIMLHYVELCIAMAVLGVFFLIGGIFLQKFKLWANQLVSIVSVLFIVALIGSCTTLAFATFANDPLFTMISIFIIIAWSFPVGILIGFLNKKRVKALFV